MLLVDTENSTSLSFHGKTSISVRFVVLGLVSGCVRRFESVEGGHGRRYGGSAHTSLPKGPARSSKDIQIRIPVFHAAVAQW